MRRLRKLFFFTVGGLGYMGIELLWRGWTHGSMFFAGGASFLLLGRISRKWEVLTKRALLGAAAITAVELATGLLVNRSFAVWDYRKLPFHFLGQICLPYSLLWIPVGLAGCCLYEFLENRLRPGQGNPESF